MKKKSDYILSWAKKLKAVNMLGGKCELCGDKNIFHLTFHHKDKNDKSYEINKIKNYRWSIIEKEIKKCSLLCHNCHQKLHNENEIDHRCASNKKLFLEIKSNRGCEWCGYNNCNGSLQFHHTGKKNYKFTGFSAEFKTIYEIEQEMIDELDECIVLCANCHNKYHTNTEIYYEHEQEIINKSNTLRENSPKINRNLVKKLYFEDGLRQLDISIQLNCGKSTISDIIKEFKKGAVV